MAELEDYRGIKKSSLYLSRFFRYLFRSERIAPLKDEFALTEDYMDLMKERFLDCFESIWDIDESLLSLRVPPLIVHSFVENIFKYAVTEGNVITITISLFREGPYAVVSIRDDGPGMEEEILEKIRQEQPVEKADGTHIGIYNANYRLNKLVSPDCRLEVRSHLTEGTEVTIRLPLDT
jgi:sensor histidine kinase YesM